MNPLNRNAKINDLPPSIRAAMEAVEKGGDVAPAEENTLATQAYDATLTKSPEDDDAELEKGGVIHDVVPVNEPMHKGEADAPKVMDNQGAMTPGGEFMNWDQLIPNMAKADPSTYDPSVAPPPDQDPARLGPFGWQRIAEQLRAADGVPMAKSEPTYQTPQPAAQPAQKSEDVMDPIKKLENLVKGMAAKQTNASGRRVGSGRGTPSDPIQGETIQVRGRAPKAPPGSPSNPIQGETIHIRGRVPRGNSASMSGKAVSPTDVVTQTDMHGKQSAPGPDLSLRPRTSRVPGNVRMRQPHQEQRPMANQRQSAQRQPQVPSSARMSGKQSGPPGSPGNPIQGETIHIRGRVPQPSPQPSDGGRSSARTQPSTGTGNPQRQPTSGRMTGKQTNASGRRVGSGRGTPSDPIQGETIQVRGRAPKAPPGSPSNPIQGETIHIRGRVPRGSNSASMSGKMSGKVPLPGFDDDGLTPLQRKLAGKMVGPSDSRVVTPSDAKMAAKQKKKKKKGKKGEMVGKQDLSLRPRTSRVPGSMQTRQPHQEPRPLQSQRQSTQRPAAERRAATPPTVTNTSARMTGKQDLSLRPRTSRVPGSMQTRQPHQEPRPFQSQRQSTQRPAAERRAQTPPTVTNTSARMTGKQDLSLRPRTSRVPGSMQTRQPHQEPRPFQSQRQSTQRPAAERRAATPPTVTNTSAPRMRRSEDGTEHWDMRKGGLYAFKDYRNDDAQALPESMLPQYLAAFVEEAYESEKRECAHKGLQPMAGQDIHDFWAQRVMSELVKTMRRNKDLMRAGKSATTKDIAMILRTRGIVKPESKSYVPTDRDAWNAMGAADQPIEDMAYSMAMREDHEARPGLRLAKSAVVSPVIIDDTVDPFNAAMAQQRAHAAHMGNTLQHNELWKASVSHDCPIHGMGDLTKGQNLVTPMGKCTCG